MRFEDIFATKTNPRQDNFRLRLFGMFSEQIVRCWAQNQATRYDVDVLRPTVFEGSTYSTVTAGSWMYRRSHPGPDDAVR